MKEENNKSGEKGKREINNGGRKRLAFVAGREARTKERQIVNSEERVIQK